MLCQLSVPSKGPVLDPTTKQPSSTQAAASLAPTLVHLRARADGKVVRQREDVDAMQEVPLAAGPLLESC